MGPLQLAQDIGSKWIYWPWVGDHLDEIRTRLAEHITLTFWAVLLGFLIAFPLALLAVRYRRLYPPVIGVTGVLYTIPSIALFVFLIPWTGLSRTTALVPLVAYTLLILIRNIVAGLDGVPPEVREAAQGMGYRRLRQLFSVELPLALPAIVAGIRIATVTTINGMNQLPRCRRRKTLAGEKMMSTKSSHNEAVGAAVATLGWDTYEGAGDESGWG